MTLDFLDCMSEKSKMLNVDRWYNDGYGNKKWFLKVLWVGTAVSFKNTQDQIRSHTVIPTNLL